MANDKKTCPDVPKPPEVKWPDYKSMAESRAVAEEMIRKLRRGTRKAQRADWSQRHPLMTKIEVFAQAHSDLQ